MRNRNRRVSILCYTALLAVCSVLPLHAQFQQQGNKVVATGANGKTGLGLAAALSFDGNTAIVGGVSDSDNGAWIFVRNNGVWSQQGGKLAGSGVVGNLVQQGIAVAISGDGNTVIFGGPLDNNMAGAAWVFTRTNGVWTQQGNKLVGSGATGNAEQGISVALSSDGNTALVGGFADNGGIGAAWVFTRANGVWTQQGAKLIGSGATEPAAQGSTVALSGDGNTALVGGPGDNGGVGATWVFTRANGVWTQQGTKLVGSASSGAPSQSYALGLSQDGSTALITGPFDNTNVGATWIFTRTNGVWSQQGGKLVAGDATGAALQGFSGSTSSDGSVIAIGGPNDNNKVGATWVFTRSNGVWTQFGSKLVGTGAIGNAQQGLGSGLSGDAQTLVAGGPSDNTNTGAAWFFSRQATNPPPAPSGLTPVVSSGANQVFSVTFNAPNGFQTLDVVNVLINNVLDGRQACYLAYSPSTNMLSIVGDAGDASQLTGKVMDGNGTISNSQCTVNFNGSSATGTGTTLRLVLNLAFSTSFGGNRVIYAAARDAQNNSGWSLLGVTAVPPLPGTFPKPVSMDPSSGNTMAPTIKFTYQDQTDVSNLQTVWGLFNTAIDGRSACYFAYYRPGNQLYLFPDNGDGTQATNITLAGNNTISNSQCTISAQGASVQASGNTLSVTLPITFKSSFAGFKGVWMAAQTLGGAATSPWQALGAWSVPAP